MIKTTKEDCEIRRGKYITHTDPLPEDLVDCALPPSGRVAGTVIGSVPGGSEAPAPQVLASVYDYLYRAGTERPQYGLYSYVLFPVPSERAERFLEELFKTTSFADITKSTSYSLNVIYLPTRYEKLSRLKPLVRNGAAPPASLFISEIYDYRLGRQILLQICSAPAKTVSDICQSDLSRGPYLFTYALPVSTLSTIPPPYLVVDLSRVHEQAFGEFVSAYKEQVKRIDYTDLQRIENLRLRLLSIILIAADWIGPLKGAMADILHLATQEYLQDKPAR